MKIKKLALSVLLSLVILSVAIFGGMFIFYVSATEVDVPDAGELFNWETSAEWTDEGALATRDYNSADKYAAGIGLRRQFDVSNGKEIKITFRVPVRNHDTREVLAGQTTSTIDLSFVNVQTNKRVYLRFWLDGNANLNQNATSVGLCNGTGTWVGPYIFKDWIKGVATNESSFTIGFNTTEFIKYEIAGGSYGKPDYGADKEAAEALLAEYFTGCETLEIWFGRQELQENTKNEIIVMEVNGQSLASANGKINDTVAPIVPDIQEAASDTEYTANNNLSVFCKEWLTDSSDSAAFIVNPCYDIISGADLIYKLKVTDADENFEYLGTWNESMRCISDVRFSKAGTYKLQLEVEDSAGNIGISSNALEITVVKGFELILSGQVPSKGIKGNKIILPTATSSDKYGIAHDVNINVQSPVGTAIELDEDNSFVPTTVGIHYVTYASSYVDADGKTQTVKEEYRITVTEENTETPPVKNEGCQGCNGTFTGSLVVGAMAAVGVFTIFLFKKRKKD